MSDEKTIAKKQGSELMKPTYEMAIEDYVQGTDDLTREDLQIPVVTLVQAQSNKVPDNLKHLGEFYNNLTGEFASELNAVVLSLVKGRIAFDRAFDRESEPLCASDDASMPRAEYIGKTFEDTNLGITHTIDDQGCALCPFSRFGENGEPPLCSKVYTYAMLDAATGLPFLVQAQRTGAVAGKQLNTIAKTMGRRKFIRVSSTQVQDDKGNYFKLLFSTNGEVEADLKTYAAKLSGEVGNIAQRFTQSERIVEERAKQGEERESAVTKIPGF